MKSGRVRKKVASIFHKNITIIIVIILWEWVPRVGSLMARKHCCSCIILQPQKQNHPANRQGRGWERKKNNLRLDFLTAMHLQHLDGGALVKWIFSKLTKTFQTTQNVYLSTFSRKISIYLVKRQFHCRAGRQACRLVGYCEK